VVAYSVLISFVTTFTVNAIVVACLPIKTITEEYKFVNIQDTILNKRDTIINKKKYTQLDTTYKYYKYEEVGSNKYSFNVEKDGKIIKMIFSDIKIINTKGILKIIKYTSIKYTNSSITKRFIFKKLPVYREIVLVFV